MDSTRALQQPVTLSFAKALGHVDRGITTKVALSDRVQTWRWRSVRGSFCWELWTFQRNGETTGASVTARLEPGATSRMDATVSGTVDDLLPSSWRVHWRNLCNRLLHRKHWWKFCGYWFDSCMHVWRNKPRRYYTVWHNQWFASQQLEHSSEEPVQQAPPMNVGESFAATALVRVCMWFFGSLSIKFHLRKFYE